MALSFIIFAILLFGCGGIFLYRLQKQVTDGKNATNALFRNIDKLQLIHHQIIDQSSMIFLECNQDWIIRYPSQKLIDLLKINFKENLSLLEFSYQAQKENFRALAEQIITTHETIQRELSINNSEGTELWLEVNASWFEDRIYFSLTNITPRIRHKELLDRMKAGLEQTQLLCITNRAGTITYVNKAFCDRLSYASDELIGQPASFLIDDLHPKDFYAQINQSLLMGHSWQGEICQRSKIHSQHWVHCTVFPVLDNDGTPHQFLHVSQDITQQKALIHQISLKQMEAEASSNRMQALVESSVDGIIVINSQSCILEYNPSCEKIFGFSRDAVLGKELDEVLIPTRFRKKHRLGLDRIAQKERSSIIGTTIEVNALRKGGGEFPLELSIFNYQIQGQSFFGAFVRDNTIKKIADISLKSSMRKLEVENKLWNMIDEVQAILNHSSVEAELIESLLQAIGKSLNWDIVQVYRTTHESDNNEVAVFQTHWCQDIDKHREFINVSKNFKFKKGLGVIGKAWETQKVTWVSDVPNDPEFLRNAKLKNFSVYTGVAVPITIYGEVYCILEAFTENLLMEDPDYTRALQIVAHLFTSVIKRNLLLAREIQVREEMASHARMSTLGELSSGIAHEINNPLMVLSGQAKKALYFLDQPEKNHSEAALALKKIVDHSSRIAKIVHGLRLFSRDDSQDEFMGFSVSTLVEDSLEICRPVLNHSKIDLHLDLIDSSINLECRPGQISQVLVNLIQNSNDAVINLETRWIKLKVSSINDSIEFKITDSGNGIPSPFAEKIFNPFFTTKPVGKGTGLGLSISKGIIEAHSGTFSIDAECKNTCFVITIPKKQPLKKAA